MLDPSVYAGSDENQNAIWYDCDRKIPVNYAGSGENQNAIWYVENRDSRGNATFLC